MRVGWIFKGLCVWVAPLVRLFLNAAHFRRVDQGALQAAGVRTRVVHAILNHPHRGAQFRWVDRSVAVDPVTATGVMRPAGRVAWAEVLLHDRASNGMAQVRAVRLLVRFGDSLAAVRRRVTVHAVNRQDTLPEDGRPYSVRVNKYGQGGGQEDFHVVVAAN